MSSRIHSSFFFRFCFLWALLKRGRFVHVLIFASASAQITTKKKHPAATHVELACCRQSTASTGTAPSDQPCTRAKHAVSTYVPIRARQRKQAERVGESHPALECIYSSLRSQNERRIESTGENIHATTSKQLQLVMRKGCACLSNRNKIQHYYSSFSPSFLFRTYGIMHAFGVRAIVLEHGALGICKSSVVT